MNRWRPQVDPKVMDLGDPVGFQMGFWGGNLINIFGFSPCDSYPSHHQDPGLPSDPAFEEKNPSDDLIIFD